MYYEVEGVGAPLVFIPPALGFAGHKSFPALTPPIAALAPSQRKALAGSEDLPRGRRHVPEAATRRLEDLQERD